MKICTPRKFPAVQYHNLFFVQVADIGAFATSSEALLSVLTDGDLVTWGKRQEFQRQ